MKWRELYLSLSFEVPLGEGAIASAFLEALAHGESLPARFCVFAGTDQHPEPIFTDEKFGIIIKKIASVPDKPQIMITFMTAGILPPGLIHGSYRLRFSPDGFTSSQRLPGSLFVEEDARVECIPELRWSELEDHAVAS